MSAIRLCCAAKHKFILIGSAFHAHPIKPHRLFSGPQFFPVQLLACLSGSLAICCFCILISGCSAYIQKDSVRTFATTAQTTTTCGETGQSGTDGGDARWQLGTPCATGTNSGGYTVSSISYWVGTPTSTSFDLGVYSNSSGSPSSLLCSVSTGTITPSSGWNSVSINSCPTLSASTTYWIGYLTGSNAIEQGTVGGVCPGTSYHSTWANAQLSGASLASPFPANTQGSTCYSLYMTLSPATAASQSVCGETGQSGTDSGNAFWQLGTPCATGTNAGGYTVSKISYWVGTPTSTSFDLGVFSNSSGSPRSLLCSVSTGTITPSSGWNSVSVSSCPTLSASTTYWIGYITGSNAISQGTVSGVCPGTSYHSTWANAQLSGASLANPFPANTQGSTCYSLYMTLNPATGTSQSAGSGQAIGVNATSLSFGGVALSQPATQPLTLTNSGTSAGSVSAVTVTGAGFSLVGSSFPITLSAGQADTLNIQFDPTVAGAASGTLTIFSSSTSNPVAQVSLSGTGVASQVDLKWNAPASSSAPVAGYNIYRSSGTSSFERLNSSVDKQTTYQDGSLQVGGTYEYYVTTVNSAGAESSPSNTTTVSVP